MGNDKNQGEVTKETQIYVLTVLAWGRQDFVL
jgi:hypothetical protein